MLNQGCSSKQLAVHTNGDYPIFRFGEWRSEALCRQRQSEKTQSDHFHLMQEYAGTREEFKMEESKKIHTAEFDCDSRCVYEYIECIEKEDGASICKTRERNCFEDCSS